MTVTVPTGPGTPVPARTTGQFGVIVFLASDVMLFAPFFAAYFLLRSTNSPWPAENADLNVIRELIFTVVLVLSSVTLVVADHAQARGDGRTMRRWLLATMVLGLAFLTNQFTEYVMMDMRAGDGAYSSIYWGLTGLHFCHVTAGIGALGLLYIRAARSPSLDEISPWANGVSIFWHLVDIIWIGVFVTIWVIQ
jgi:cytochrome c oxidase subunit 3